MAEAVDWQDGRITDEGLASMRARIGIEHPIAAWHRTVSEDAIQHFALGLGDDNPLWWDEAYAEGTRWQGIVAPPAFLYTACNGIKRDEGGGGGSGGGVEGFLPGVLALWANDRWRWHAPVRPGDRLHATGALFSVEEQRSGFAQRSVAQTDRMTFFTADGTAVAERYCTFRRFERGEGRRAGRYMEVPAARYSEAELQAIHEQYAREPEQRRGGTPRYWEDVQPGEPLLTLVKGPLTLSNLIGWVVGWGAPLCRTNRMGHQYLQQHPGARLFNPETGIEDTIESAHWDLYFARQSGLPTGYDFGAQRISWVSHMLTDWMGDDGFLVELQVNLRRPNLLGDTTWISGAVADKRRTDEGALLDCTVSATNQRGDVTADGVATVRLPTKPAQ